MVKAYLHGKPEKMLTKLASADTVVVHALEPPVPLQFIYSKDLHDQSKKSLWSLGFLLVSLTPSCVSKYVSLTLSMRG